MVSTQSKFASIALYIVYADTPSQVYGQYSYMYKYTCFNERREKEGRKKQARSNKQTTRQSNTAHPMYMLAFPPQVDV